MKTGCLGVICLDSNFPKPPGHIRHPDTFAFPSRSRIVTGVNVDRLLNHPAPDLLAPFVDAARELERDGATLIAGSCGFLARYQPELADAVAVPVIASSLLAIPLLRSMVGRGRTVAVLTAKASSLAPEHFTGVGASAEGLAVMGLEDRPLFRRAILADTPGAYDVAAIRVEVLDAVRALRERTPQMGALVLECTDLSPFMPDIQAAVPVPVVDIVSLVNMAYCSSLTPQ